MTPCLSEITPLTSIPIIDKSIDVTILIDQIARASEEYSFFQIINHGVHQDLCDEMLNAVASFFQLQASEKACFTQNDTKDGRVFSFFLKDDGALSGKVSLWSEAFAYLWNPPKLVLVGDVSAVFAKEAGVLMDRLLRLLSRGIGLEDEYLKRLGNNPTYKAQANYYPPCPDPEKTLGLAVHTDILLLTLVLPSQVEGLQVIKDGKWMLVHAVPNAFCYRHPRPTRVVWMSVLSNGRYRACVIEP
ncbi:DOWNY MILDEW RESISTANCE 6-like protein [Drosera capensis]